MALTGTAYRVAYYAAVVLALAVWAAGAAGVFGFARLGITDPTMVARIEFGAILLGGIGFFLPRVQAPPTPTRLVAERFALEQARELKKLRAEGR